MRIRRIPFGYEMKDGKLSVCTSEADTVKWIFQSYVGGASYSELTKLLNTRGICYNAEQKAWNKNMVARILDNHIYTGEQCYPPILDEDQYQKAHRAKPQRILTQEQDLNAREIRKMARCAVCGGKVKIGMIHGG